MRHMVFKYILLSLGLIISTACTKKYSSVPVVTQNTPESPGVDAGAIIVNPGASAGSAPIAFGSQISMGGEALSSGASSWQGQLVQLDPQVRVESTGQTVRLSTLQRSRPFLVVGFFDTNCPLCQSKADAFNQQAARTLLVGSTKCTYVAMVKDSSSAYSQKTNFMNSFVVTAPSSAAASFKQAVLPAGFVYPTTAVFDQSGNVVEARTNDFGPQTALSYCI